MTKEEIYNYLDYQGKYDNVVKKRLKKLIKKYHPDLNNGDDTVMKLINEVKKELENGIKVKNVDKKIFNNQNVHKKNSVEVINIITIINRLNDEVNNLNKKIENGYHDEYKLFLEYNSSLALYNTLILNEKILKNDIISLKRIKILDKLNIALILVFFLLIFQSSIFIILLIMFLYMEIIYILIRLSEIRKKEREIEKINTIDKKYKEMSSSIKDTIDKLNKDIFNIKKESIIKKEKIRAYEKIINSANDNEEKENYKQR